MKPVSYKVPVKLLTLFTAGLSAISAKAEMALNLPEPVTSSAKEILNLHNLILIICCIIFVCVFSVMFYSIFAHRKSKGAKPASFYHSTKLEIIWTIIPVLILVGMAIPSTATLIRMEDTTKSEMTIKITGYQWFWEYEYLEDGVQFFSKLATPRAQIENLEPKGENYLLEVDNEVVLPVNKKVRLLFTAADVIHAWWLPQFGIKKDAIPGYITESWINVEKQGTYTGQCAELCGKDHGFMPIVVRAVSEQDYMAWVDENKTQPEQAVEEVAAASEVEAEQVSEVETEQASGSETSTGDFQESMSQDAAIESPPAPPEINETESQQTAE